MQDKKRKAGRPKMTTRKEDTGKRLSVLLDRSAAEALEALQEATGVSATKLVEQSILAYSAMKEGAAK